ncbi:hypothetical protein [Streptomyces sp. NPDC096030]|uniref:hypothetical protein n=1 Tax=Streptomyces sp. NPDC096030 TaxID=3155423 RepID=UPI00331DA065
MSDASSYFLTEEQVRARFDERVKEFVFSGYKPQENPAALVLLGGQPAAGKSQAMAATVRRHGGTLVPLTPASNFCSLLPRRCCLRSGSDLVLREDQHAGQRVQRFSDLLPPVSELDGVRIGRLLRLHRAEMA